MKNKKGGVLLPGKILWLTGMFRIYKDGDGYSPLCRPWHPVYWIMFLALIPLCAILGEKISNVLPCRVSNYFHEHPEKLVFINPFKI